LSTKIKGESSTGDPSKDGITSHNNGWCYDKMDAAYSEAHRHQCEILSMARMYREHGADKVKGYLLQVEKARGTEAAERLRYATASHLGLGKT